MENLYEETIKTLKEHGKTFDDVVWCGSYSEWMEPDEFKAIAEITKYDSGYGGQEVASDLLVVGKDFWLSRGEYDGSEWWEFHTPIVKPSKKSKAKTFCNGDSWATLEQMNKPGGKYSNS